jgi:glycerophosphoryl diester phosphodiesterase
VIAHRGASNAYRENTLEAFRGAAALGADAVESDVRRTADGVPVIHHDAAVPGLGPIVSATAGRLPRLAPWVPTLEEALGACAGMWVDVEVKNSPGDPDWDPSDALIEEVVASLESAGRVATALLSSFNAPTLARARALAPGLPTGWLIGRHVPPKVAVREAVEAGHRALLPHAPALAGPSGPAAIEAAHEAGLMLVCWTLDGPDEVRRLAAAGIDAVITNRPDVALLALDEHDHHHRG